MNTTNQIIHFIIILTCQMTNYMVKVMKKIPQNIEKERMPIWNYTSDLFIQEKHLIA